MADEDLRVRVRTLSERVQALFAATDRYVDATDAELVLLRAVADAAGKDIAARGKMQTTGPLHIALAAWYRHLAEHAPQEPAPRSAP